MVLEWEKREEKTYVTIDAYISWLVTRQVWKRLLHDSLIQRRCECATVITYDSIVFFILSCIYWFFVVALYVYHSTDRPTDHILVAVLVFFFSSHFFFHYFKTVVNLCVHYCMQSMKLFQVNSPSKQQSKSQMSKNSVRC